MTTSSICLNPLHHHSNCGDCNWALTPSPVSSDDELSLPATPYIQSEKSTKNVCVCSISKFQNPPKPESDRPHPILKGEREEITKQMAWKYWQWPPAQESDYCLLPSDTSMPPNRVCVALGPTKQKRNIPQSQTFFVSPTTVIFRQNCSKGTWDEFAWIRVQNKGKISRRLSLIPPNSPHFNIIWAAALNENTNVAPGLFTRILVKFVPGAIGNKSMKEELLIRVEGDGGITIPLVAMAQEPPMLEMEDFNMSCCLVGNKVAKAFKIINRGGCGRFWILSESEFTKEYIDIPSTATHLVTPLSYGEIDGEGESIFAMNQEEDAENKEDTLDVEEVDPEVNASDSIVGEDLTNFTNENEGESVEFGEKPPPNSPIEQKVTRLDQVNILPFRLAPCCFSLKENQEIILKISFRPTEPKFYYEKIAMLCDNSEVRWFALKGLGIEPKTQKVITVTGENWTLEGEKTMLDLNVMSPHEIMSQKVTVRNTSSLPVYFFWEISRVPRPFPPTKASVQTETEGDDLHMPQTQYEIQGESGESPRHLTHNIPNAGEGESSPIRKISIENEVEYMDPIPLCMSPCQGLLRGCSEVICDLDVLCPEKVGPYASQIDFYIQQLSHESVRTMAMMTAEEIQAEIERQINKVEANKPGPFDVEAYMNLPKFTVPSRPSDPMQSLEVHLQCIPLQCWFDPTTVLTRGYAFTQIKQKISFYNSTKYAVELSLDGFQAEFCHVTVSPKTMTVLPYSHICIKLTMRFQAPGQCESGLKGILKLPYMEIDGFVPMKMISEIPLIMCDPNVVQDDKEPMEAIIEENEDEIEIQGEEEEEKQLNISKENEEENVASTPIENQETLIENN